MEESVRLVWQELPHAQARECLELLLRVFSNILKDPTEVKFRSLKKSSKAVSAKLAVSSAAVELLLRAGFEEQPEAYVFPEDAGFELLAGSLEILQAALLEDAGASEACGRQPAAPEPREQAAAAVAAVRRRRAAAAGRDPEASQLADLRKTQRDKFKDHEFMAALDGAPPRHPSESTLGSTRSLGDTAQAPVPAVPDSVVPQVGAGSQAEPRRLPQGKQKQQAPKSNYDFTSRAEAERSQGKATDLADISKLRAAKFQERKAQGGEEDNAEERWPMAPSSSDDQGSQPAATSAAGSATATSGSRAGPGSWTAGWLPDSSGWLPAGAAGWLGGSPPKGPGKMALLTPEKDDVRTIKFEAL